MGKKLGADVVILLSAPSPEPIAEVECAESKDAAISPAAYLAYGLCETVGLGMVTGKNHCADILTRDVTCARWIPNGRQLTVRGVTFRVARVKTLCRIPDGWSLAATASGPERSTAITTARQKALARIDEVDGLVQNGFFDPNR
jgi:hypothetical protein